MTKEELAKHYVENIKSSSSKVQLVKSIINEIDNLTYIKTKKTISASDKIWILEYIHEQLSSNLIQYGLNYIEKSADNKYYLILITNALEMLNGGRK
ncbi:hypothetical protein [Neobacillus ginsengisoli]|uniref:Uncharacterized protein n=1 Tax=Neobacillus ginsengisoli TaxID=904295 RepID=A0ABT9Y2Y2_9BACI|nr:hypothetical protein [Neobacillus ginsengisoli]MDQ0202178.1 hypothetical protein [Neobacillus ginsengisoli]